MVKKFKDLKVKQRLILCFMMVVCIASISGILGTVLLYKMDMDYSEALVVNGFSQGEIGNFNTYLNKGSAVVRDIVLLTDAAELDAARAELEEITKSTSDALVKMRENCTTEKELAYLKVIEETLPQYQKLRDQVVELGIANKNDEALDLFRTQARPLLNEAMTAAQGLADLNVVLGEDVSASLTKGSRATMIIIIVVIVTAILVGVLFAVYIAKSFATPIISIQGASAKLADGELDIQLEAYTQDEIGDMTRSFKDAITMLKSYITELSRGLGEVAKGNFNISTSVPFKGSFQELEDAINAITLSLSQIMRQINEASEQVALGSSQMAESAQSLAVGATEQAGAVEELTATIESVAGLVEESAIKASKASTDAKKFEVEAEVSSREMQELVSAMARINVTSKQIENIIAEIEDIASQTNLLSLNASIEAARAGEAGRGFAVVADQIGKLASESAGSAVNTRKLIENAIQEIEKGNEITVNTMQSIDKVIEGIRLLAKASDEISTMSNSQAESMEQIEAGIEQISGVIQSNSAAAQETSATSEELSAQSENLKGLIGKFILRK